MDYYNEIKNELVSNEVYSMVKDYSKNRYQLEKYYNVGKLLSEAGKHYGERIIDIYFKKLQIEVGKKYNKRTLFRIRQFYNFFANKKVSPVATQLSWSHYTELLPIKDENKFIYYLNISINHNLSKRQLRDRIKSNEYERLSNNAKNKLIKNDNITIEDNIKHPIMISNKYDTDNITEKMLKEIILDNITSFMKELGDGFSFIDSEYKIKLGDSFNYIDLLFFNYKFNCFVVIELKVTELKKEHIGQIRLYMNYIDKNIKKSNHEDTIGIIIVKKDNKYVIEYSSDERIYRTTYLLI